MKMQILQFANAELQKLHELAATTANTAQPYGPFVGEWWEAYLSSVILAVGEESRPVIEQAHEKSRHLAEELQGASAVIRDLHKAASGNIKQIGELEVKLADAEELIRKLQAARNELAQTIVGSLTPGESVTVALTGPGTPPPEAPVNPFKPKE